MFELNEFNEGWYSVRNGIVYYLEGFNSYVPLYVRVVNNQQQNGFVLIEADGNVIFDTSYDNLLFKKPYEKQETETIDIQQYQQQDNNQETSEQATIQPAQNQITGAVTGLEQVTGMQVRVERSGGGSARLTGVRGCPCAGTETRPGVFGFRVNGQPQFYNINGQQVSSTG